MSGMVQRRMTFREFDSIQLPYLIYVFGQTNKGRFMRGSIGSIYNT